MRSQSVTNITGKIHPAVFQLNPTLVSTGSTNGGIGFKKRICFGATSFLQVVM
jgi:hypothetical protein